ncbi:MAG: P-loop NTPase fold protein [Snowella sp.]|nr:P-loop NTPase fold protein [Snowella sp.]
MTSTNTIHKNLEGSRAQVQEKLKLFMNDDNFKILALKGKWGVGKTHLVETFFDEQKQDFYYGSVFGISSIEQLKSQILANKGVAGKIIKLINDQADKLTKIRSLFGFAGSSIAIGNDLLLDLVFNSINGFICIDDLERKSKLGLIELLGFVENLIQKSNCKVILIVTVQGVIKKMLHMELDGITMKK